MNNIQMSESEARSIRSLFGTQGWRTFMEVMKNSRETARNAMEASLRDEKTRQLQGACLMLRDVCNIEQNIRDILRD